METEIKTFLQRISKFMNDLHTADMSILAEKIENSGWEDCHGIDLSIVDPELDRDLDDLKRDLLLIENKYKIL